MAEMQFNESQSALSLSSEENSLSDSPQSLTDNSSELSLSVTNNLDDSNHLETSQLEQQDRKNSDRSTDISFLLKVVDIQQKELEKLQSSLKDLGNLVAIRVNNLSEQISSRQEDCTRIARRIQNEDDEKRVQSEFLEKKLSILAERNRDLELKNSQLEIKLSELEEEHRLILEEVGIKSKQVTQLETERQKSQEELQSLKSLLTRTTNQLEFNHGQIERIQKQLSEEKSLSKQLKIDNEALIAELEENKLENINLQNSYYSELKSIADRAERLETEKQNLQLDIEEANTLLGNLQLDNKNLQVKLKETEIAHKKTQKDFEQVTTNLRDELDVAARKIGRYQSRINLTKLQTLLLIAFVSATSIVLFNFLKPAIVQKNSANQPYSELMN
jgi:chromosome segregation ATPase